jgi:hypothetical protein
MVRSCHIYFLPRSPGTSPVLQKLQSLQNSQKMYMGSYCVPYQRQTSSPKGLKKPSLEELFAELEVSTPSPTPKSVQDPKARGYTGINASLPGESPLIRRDCHLADWSLRPLTRSVTQNHRSSHHETRLANLSSASWNATMQQQERADKQACGNPRLS